MSLIIEKLQSAGVSENSITALSKKFGDKLIDEIQKNGLKLAAERAGIDPEKLPDLDFSHLMEMGDDMLGKRDSDGDGKTGFAEMKDTMSDFANKVGIGSAIKNAKNVVAEAKGEDSDGDGKTGALEAMTEVKKSIVESEIAKKAISAAGGLFSKMKGFMK